MIFSVIIVKILALPAVASAKHNSVLVASGASEENFPQCAPILTFDTMWEANL
jgi:hypothetical protein